MVLCEILFQTADQCLASGEERGWEGGGRWGVRLEGLCIRKLNIFRKPASSSVLI